MRDIETRRRSDGDLMSDIKPISREVTEGLAPMFEEAIEKGLWFHCSYQDIWMSPEDLKQSQSEGLYRWGAVNWRLEDPQIHLKQLESRATSARSAVEAFGKRINK